MAQQLSFTSVMESAAKLPLVRIDRTEFLTKNLNKLCTPSQLQKAISEGTLQADIPIATLDSLANAVINAETIKVTAISAAAGFKDKNGNWTELAKSYNVKSDDDFLKNPKAQEAAVRGYHRDIFRQVKSKGLLDYVGKTINGETITESGLLSAAHLVGPGKLRQGLEAGDLSGETYDINPHALQYLVNYGGYNIDAIK